VANTLAYCNTTTITAVRSFIVQAPGVNITNLRMLIIYRVLVTINKGMN
jgi:hypothetical protein